MLRLDLLPQPGYPFGVRLEATYVLSVAGLRLDLAASNTGDGGGSLRLHHPPT